jgi:hypothetical protein
MRDRRRLLLTVALLSAGLAALVGTGRRLSRPAPPDGAEGEREREARLEYQLQVARWRYEVKRRVVWRLLRGWITLAQAAAQFGWLNERPADCPCPDGHLWPGAPREEKLCRQVFTWAREFARDEEGGAEAVVRFERELKALLARPDGVRLPRPDSEPLAGLGEWPGREARF